MHDIHDVCFLSTTLNFDIKPISGLYRCNDYYMDKGKTFTKKISMTSQLSRSLIGSNGWIHSKSRAWCHSFQPIKAHNLCFVVFCLLFSVIVDQQNKVSHPIHTQSYDINTKQLPWSQLIPKLSNILGVNPCDIMFKYTHKSTLWKTRNYYNDNNMKLWRNNI